MTVNAPESGIIREFLANEEDTVTVGQDLIKLEPGAAPEESKKQAGEQKPSEPTKTQPEEPKKIETEQNPAQAAPAPSPPKKETSPAPQSAKSPAEEPRQSVPGGAGSREERRVQLHLIHTQTSQLTGAVR